MIQHVIHGVQIILHTLSRVTVELQQVCIYIQHSYPAYYHFTFLEILFLLSNSYKNLRHKMYFKLFACVLWHTDFSTLSIYTKSGTRNIHVNEMGHE